MKISQLLPICSATAILAKVSLSHVVNFGVSRVQPLLTLSESPVCLNEAPAFEDPLDEQRKLAESLWPLSTPCHRNGTREFCVYSNPLFASGRGITILTSPARAITIARSALFTNSTQYEKLGHFNAAESPRWKVVPSPGKGYGLVATQNLLVGDHIMSTTASIMVDYDLFRYVPDAQLLAMEVEGVGYLPPVHRARLMNLTTHDEADGYEDRVSKIITMNAFDIEDAGLVSGEEEEKFYTVFTESGLRPARHVAPIDV